MERVRPFLTTMPKKIKPKKGYRVVWTIFYHTIHGPPRRGESFFTSKTQARNYLIRTYGKVPKSVSLEPEYLKLRKKKSRKKKRR